MSYLNRSCFYTFFILLITFYCVTCWNYSDFLILQLLVEKIINMIIYDDHNRHKLLWDMVMDCAAFSVEAEPP